MENMKKVPKAPAATEISPVGSWSQLHPTFVPDSLMYLNNDGECVFFGWRHDRQPKRRSRARSYRRSELIF